MKINEKFEICEKIFQTLPKKIPIKKISENYTFAKKIIEGLKEKISIISEEHQRNFSIILVGSYGRLESSRQSDLDYCIVYNDNLNDDDKITIKNNIQTTFQKNFDKKISLFLDLPFSEILTNIGGKFDKSIDFTTRILILMESLPIINSNLYNSLITKLCSNYLEEFEREEKYPLFLTNEIIRFWRTLCIDYRWKKIEKEQPWGLRNIKLRFSRKLLCFSTIILLTFLYKKNIDPKDFRKFITYPSSIKLMVIYTLIQKDKKLSERSFLLGIIEEIIIIYDDFLKNIYNEKIRDSLEALKFEERNGNEHYIRLKEKAKRFHNKLIELVQNLDSEIVKKYLIM